MCAWHLSRDGLHQHGSSSLLKSGCVRDEVRGSVICVNWAMNTSDKGNADKAH